MFRLFDLSRDIHPAHYAVVAPALLVSQHMMVALAYAAAGQPLKVDAGFWLLPLRTFAQLPQISSPIVGAGVFFSLAATCSLIALSMRRARHHDFDRELAVATAIPILQYIAVLALIVRKGVNQNSNQAGHVWPVLAGVLAGTAVIVLAVVVSALAFGVYGWGLFVGTPFTVGIATGYLANRRKDLGGRRTGKLALLAAGLGCLSLIALALEGIICILMAAPLGAAFVLMGSEVGRMFARLHNGSNPLMSVAFLPALFALEAAVPPSVAFQSSHSIEIAAAPAQVWQALTSAEAVAADPGLAFRMGLAYPVRGRLLGRGVGAERLGTFSTGLARERITAWEPGRRLGFVVLSQPPVMTEFSPYDKVHAPHVSGYFETKSSRFDLRPLANGGTRLTVSASHVLRADPVPYWEPIARWAIEQNSTRVLRDLKYKSEGRAG